ncbi:MAG: hypothetical protein BHW64_02205 [Candidatus Melainabacteria bacterium LEY3_CP_29_8]|nr:MAG: hypothetical protein BHW64_02205 [Candidatus Melainabacteria bacterium LEY3_CP_29_8]
MLKVTNKGTSGLGLLNSSSSMKTLQGSAGVAGIVVNEAIKKHEENLKQEALYKDTLVLDNIRNKYILDVNEVNKVDNAVKAYGKEANDYLENDSELCKLYKPVDKNVDLLSGVKNLMSNIAQKTVNLVKKQV